MSPNQTNTLVDSAVILNSPMPDMASLLESIKPRIPRPDQIDWSRYRNQRKNRKNARRAFAAGNRQAFNK